MKTWFLEEEIEILEKIKNKTFPSIEVDPLYATCNEKLNLNSSVDIIHPICHRKGLLGDMELGETNIRGDVIQSSCIINYELMN